MSMTTTTSRNCRTSTTPNGSIVYLNGSAISPLATEPAAASAGDVDNANVKYNKRLKQQQSQRKDSTSSSHSGGHYRYRVTLKDSPLALGLFVTMIGCCLIGIWEYTLPDDAVSSSVQQRVMMEQRRRMKIESVWKQRNYDAPHLQGDPRRRQAQRLEETFASQRLELNRNKKDKSTLRKMLLTWLDDINHDILSNARGGARWIRPYLLPPLPGLTAQGRNLLGYLRASASEFANDMYIRSKRNRPTPEEMARNKQFFIVDRGGFRMVWEDEWDALTPEQKLKGPPVDYTNPQKYQYPPLLMEPPSQGGYPQLQPLQEIMNNWHQDQDNPNTITETLIHFNYSNPVELAAAQRFRDAELPFKLYDVPEVTATALKWTDEYVAQNFAAGRHPRFLNTQNLASGTCQESANNYFAFFVPKLWNVDIMGLAPVRNNDWNFVTWAKHAHYADATALAPDQPHFYWQAGVDPQERYGNPRFFTFISKDLPSFSATTPNFFLFNPEKQKGIQCRFGERGVVAATHYDSGRNMIAMLTGAKRYILSPPNQCSKLGIFTHKTSPIYRHSLLNFGHLREWQKLQQQTASDQNNTTTTTAATDGKEAEHKDEDNTAAMSPEERAWLQRAATAKTVETVLKQGEVLYLPSQWFHYIVSLQKSAQCNVRSGQDEVGTKEFGGLPDVERCMDD